MAGKSPSRRNKTWSNAARRPSRAGECSDGQSTGRQGLVPPSAVPVLFGLAVMVSYVFGMLMHTSDIVIGDEPHHVPQIQAFTQGIFDGVGRNWVTMLPGYHAIVAAVAWVVGAYSPSEVRILSAILVFPAIVMFFLCARALDKDNRANRSLMFLLCPIVFPYFFLVYTDIMSVLFLLGMLFLVLKRRYQLAGLVGWGALLVRQTNIVWAFFLVLIVLEQEGLWRQLAHRDWKPALQTVARLWLFVLAGFAFLAFVYWNGGVALGVTQYQHELGSIYPTQGYLWLFTMFFLFLPLHLWNVPRIVAMLRRRPALWVFIGICSFVLYIQTFWVNHEWNYSQDWWRNWLLAWLREDVWNRSLAFLPMLWAVCSLCVTPFARRSFYWLYPLAILAVLPSGLIEQRYFMVPAVLFMLFAKWKNVHVDRLTLAMYVLASLYVYDGIHWNKFFP